MTRRKSYQKGSVQQHNGQWTVVYREYDHAKRRWKQKREQIGKHRTKKEAQRAAEPVMARVNERNNLSEVQQLYSQITFKQFVKTRWRAYTVSAKHQASTIDTHNSLINFHMLPFFGEMNMKDITPSSISDFLNSREGLAPSSRGDLYRLLNLMLEIARQYDFIPHNPIRPLVHRPERVNVKKPTLQPEQIRDVIANLPERERLFILLIAVTGIRMGEALALRWMNFNADSRTITITHTLYRRTLKEPKTKTSKGTLRLHPYIVSLLAAHKEQSSFRADDDFIFCNAAGGAFCRGGTRRHLHKAMDKAGIKRERKDYGFHIFRHSAATLLFESIGDISQVQSVLRHADKATTDGYVHVDHQPTAEASELLAEVILGKLDANCFPIVTQKSQMVS